MPLPRKDNKRSVLGSTQHERVPLNFFLQPRFGLLLKACREKQNLPIRAAALQARMKPTTWIRIEHGGDTMMTTALQLCMWMFQHGQVEVVFDEPR